MKLVSAIEAVRVVRSGDRVFIHSVAAAPQALIMALAERAPELRNVEIVQLQCAAETIGVDVDQVRAAGQALVDPGNNEGG